MTLLFVTALLLQAFERWCAAASSNSSCRVRPTFSSRDSASRRLGWLENKTNRERISTQQTALEEQ